MYILSLFTITFLLCFFGESKSQNDDVVFYDSFDHLNNWETFTFSSGKKPTEFDIITEHKNNYLKIISDSSASGLICKTKFNPNKYPQLKWKWKVNNIIPNMDGKTKEGDDYPLRIFVMFEKDSSEISFWESIEKSAVKLLSGYDLPHKSLCYVWANSEENKLPYLSPYSDDVMIIPLQTGSKYCNQWIEESVNFIKDFKENFKEDVPSIACIAISGDTDNSLSRTISFIDFIIIN